MGGALQHRSTNPNDSRVCLPEHSERERAHLIVSDFIKEDNYKKKQSGTEEEYKEKDQLLEECKQLYLDQEKKTESACARAEKDKSAASDLRSAALKRLAATRPGDEGTPLSKKRSTSFADVYAQRNQEREERRERELKVKEEALKVEKEKIEISRIQAETP